PLTLGCISPLGPYWHVPLYGRTVFRGPGASEAAAEYTARIPDSPRDPCVQLYVGLEKLRRAAGPGARGVVALRAHRRGRRTELLVCEPMGEREERSVKDGSLPWVLSQTPERLLPGRTYVPVLALVEGLADAVLSKEEAERHPLLPEVLEVARYIVENDQEI